MQFTIFFLIVFSVFALGYGYVGWRLIPQANLPPLWSTLLWIAVITAFLLPVASVVLSRIGYEEFSGKFAWLTYVSMGFFSFLFTLIIIRDAGLLILFIGKKFVSLFGNAAGASAEPDDPGRRQMIKQSVNLAIIGISAGLTGYGIYEARRRPSVKEIEIPLAGLPSSLEGFRIVQITDIHAGLTVKRDFVSTIVNMVNDLSADLVAFTGDMVDGSVEVLKNDVAPFAKLKAKYGVYFVTGNHEYYSGVDEWIDEAGRLGMKVLLNSHDALEIGDGRILIAGVTDHSGKDFSETHRSDPALAVSGAPACDVKILLAHQPRALGIALPHGFDLLLTGHTHGGQFFPWNLAASAGQPYLSGLHNHEGTWIYVSKGTGYWGPPVRIGARSEITVITLRNSRALS